VRARGALGDAEVLADLGIGAPGGQQHQHLALARREAVGGGAGGAQGGGQRFRCGGVEVHLAGLGVADRGRHVGGVPVLEQVAGGAGLERGPDPRLLDEGGDGDDLDVPPATLDLGGGGDAVHGGHLQVHQDDVREIPGSGQHGELVERAAAVAGFTDDGHPGLRGEVGGEPRPDDLVVVDEEHPHGLVVHALTVTRALF
jgi:hypothetical protein